MKILAYPNPSAATLWRFIDPFKHMREKGVDASVIDYGIQEEDVQQADVIVIKGLVDKSKIALLYAYQQELGKKIVVDMDDDLRLDESNPFQKDHDITDAYESIKKTLEIADMVTTTTEYLADKLRKYNNNVIVLENCIDRERWDIEPKLRNESEYVRIGWAGSITHLNDLAFIEEPIKRICNDYPQVQLVFVGDTRVSKMFDGCRKEIHAGVPYEAWPNKLAGLRLDIGLAPLVHNEFNKCKSRIKYFEYAVNKIPGVYSPTVYNAHGGFDGFFGLIAPDKDRWYACIRNYIVSPELRIDIATRAYSNVVGGSKTKAHSHLLEKHIDDWIAAYRSLFI